MSISAKNVFQFLRGALRGTSGLENLWGKKIIIIGMSSIGQELLSMLCFEGPEVFFYDENLVNYNSAYVICSSVQTVLTHDAQDADIIINFLNNQLSIYHHKVLKTVNFSSIGEDSYTQGIHAFYL